jgi:hypothetical protein
MADTGVDSSLGTVPFRPSWVDRFTAWVEGLPLQAPLFYLGLGLGLVLLHMAFLWFEGGLRYDPLLPVVVFNAFAIPYLLGFIHLLDHEAVAALDTLRPALTLGAPEFVHHEFRLSHMPPVPPLIAGLILTAGTIVTESVAVVPLRYAALDRLPVFNVVFQVIDKSSAFLVGVLVYHTIRQLRLVHLVNSSHVCVNLFHLRPLQAFSRLTASTAVGIVLFVYPWMLINPELLADPVVLGYIAVFTLLALAAFVWPLYGVQSLLAREKERVLHEVDLRFEAAFSELDQRLHDGDYAAIESLNWTISSLEIQHSRLKAIPTWPWRPETLRFVLTAVALPLVLGILQYLVEQALAR